MITLNQQQLKDLESYLATIPYQFANPLFQFLENIKKEQNPQVEEVKEA
jgi:hypothetical protein